MLLDTLAKGVLLGTNYFVILFAFDNSLNNPSMIFLFEIQPLWDQMALSELVWDSTSDVEKFAVYKGGVQVYQFLMAFTVDFKAV